LKILPRLLSCPRCQQLYFSPKRSPEALLSGPLLANLNAMMHKIQESVHSCLWLCPHKSIGRHVAGELFRQLAPIARHNHVVAFQPCDDDPKCHLDVISDVLHEPSIRPVSNPIAEGSEPRTTFTLRTAIRLYDKEIGSEDSLQIAPSIFTAKDVKHALCKLKIPICRHLSLSDETVYNHFQPNCLLFTRLDGRYRPCICSRSHGRSYHFKRCMTCNAQGCLTDFGYKAWEYNNLGRKWLVLGLMICRRLGALLDGPTEPAWTCHTFSQSEIRSLPRIYREWTELMHQLRILTDQELDAKRSSKIWSTVNNLRRALSSGKQTEYVEEESVMRGARLAYQEHCHTEADTIKPSVLLTKSWMNESQRDKALLDSPPPYAVAATSLDFADEHNKTRRNT
jgi:hypothetical protein